MPGIYRRRSVKNRSGSESIREDGRKFRVSDFVAIPKMVPQAALNSERFAPPERTHASKPSP